MGLRRRQSLCHGPSETQTSATVLHGPMMPAKQQLLLYSPDQWRDRCLVGHASQEIAATHHCARNLFRSRAYIGSSSDAVLPILAA
jgi:hypothetical protein